MQDISKLAFQPWRRKNRTYAEFKSGSESGAAI